mgnify:CR=1 FL=1
MGLVDPQLREAVAPQRKRCDARRATAMGSLYVRRSFSCPWHCFQAALLRERCATHVKERRAVLTIMEQKIKKLVANAGQEARNIVVPPSAGGQTAPTPLLETPAGQRLSRELKTLARLVNASIAALKNSSRQ